MSTKYRPHAHSLDALDNALQSYIDAEQCGSTDDADRAAGHIVDVIRDGGFPVFHRVASVLVEEAIERGAVTT